MVVRLRKALTALSKFQVIYAAEPVSARRRQPLRRRHDRAGEAISTLRNCVVRPRPSARPWRALRPLHGASARSARIWHAFLPGRLRYARLHLEYCDARRTTGVLLIHQDHVGLSACYRRMPSTILLVALSALCKSQYNVIVDPPDPGAALGATTWSKRTIRRGSCRRSGRY